MKEFYQTKLPVTAEDSGKKLQHFIHEKLDKKISLKKIKAALEDNFCKVNGKIERFASYRLKSGDEVFLNINHEEKKSSDIIFSKKEILYENADLLIYNKPAGITSEEGGLYSLLCEYYKDLYKVHRLDKETSGAIIFAKSKQSQDLFIHLFRKKEVEKKYIAIVDGPLPNEKGIIDFSIGKITKIKGQTIWGKVLEKNGGLKAITEWESLKTTSDASLILCSPITGRTHQIRVHLQSLGCPLLGDKIYRNKHNCNYPAKRHFLHAFKISFPTNKGKIEVTAPLPLDMIEAIEHLFKIDFVDEYIGR